MHQATRSESGTGKNLLLAALPTKERAALMAGGKRAHFKKGQTIFAMGSPGETALLIESGRVRISVSSADGRQTILSHLGPGEVVGELAVLDGTTRSADANAATDVTGTLLGRATLLKLLHDHPTAALAIITALSKRLRQTNEAFASHAMSDGSVRLARILLRLFDDWGVSTTSGERLESRFSQTELGDMAGLTRESVNRILKQFERSDIIARDRTFLVLLNRDELGEQANQTDFLS